MGWRRGVAFLTPELVACLIAAVVAVLAIGDHSYAIYQIAHWVVFLVACFNVWLHGRRGRWFTAMLFILVAVIFNPLAAIHFRREVWEYLDAVVAVIFGAAAFFVTRGQRA
jgi:hypothetical protein